MGLKECLVTLDNPWNTYYAGQTINGQATFTFDSPKKVRGKCNKQYSNRSKWVRLIPAIRSQSLGGREEECVLPPQMIMSIVSSSSSEFTLTNPVV